MSFEQALSGLNAASQNLDVIGNNVANASTIGYKDARAEFAD
ncbi:MAG TPA: flagellar basal body protein, partial [Burkholderiaceae bacterium]|nr:flagellar basal body protein [Burkholderiaceae bacterium]